MRCPILLHSIAPLVCLVAAGSWLPRTPEKVRPADHFFLDRTAAIAAAREAATSGDILLRENDDGWYELIDEPKIVPHFDIKPGSCPNPVNLDPNSVMEGEEPGMATSRVAASIIGNAFDVTSVDVGTVALVFTAPSFGREKVIFPIQANYADTGTPFIGEGCGCHALTGDGELDLDLKFDKAQLIEEFGLAGFEDGEFLPLEIQGTARKGRDIFFAHDCIRVINHQ
jgi:hypothetical protein